MTHVITTPMLLAMARTADKHRLNRRLVTEALEKDLDPDGLHVVGMTMLHNEDQMRCEVLMKMSDTDEPTKAWVDVPLHLNRKGVNDVDWAQVVEHANDVRKALIANGVEVE